MRLGYVVDYIKVCLVSEGFWGVLLKERSVISRTRIEWTNFLLIVKLLLFII